MSDFCLYCKQDQSVGELTSDNEFVCGNCIEDMIGDEDD